MHVIYRYSDWIIYENAKIFENEHDYQRYLDNYYNDCKLETKCFEEYEKKLNILLKKKTNDITVYETRNLNLFLFLKDNNYIFFNSLLECDFFKQLINSLDELKLKLDKEQIKKEAVEKIKKQEINEIYIPIVLIKFIKCKMKKEEELTDNEKFFLHIYLEDMFFLLINNIIEVTKKIAIISNTNYETKDFEKFFYEVEKLKNNMNDFKYDWNLGIKEKNDNINNIFKYCENIKNFYKINKEIDNLFIKKEIFFDYKKFKNDFNMAIESVMNYIENLDSIYFVGSIQDFKKEEIKKYEAKIIEEFSKTDYYDETVNRHINYFKNEIKKIEQIETLNDVYNYLEQRNGSDYKLGEYDYYYDGEYYYHEDYKYYTLLPIYKDIFKE